LTLAQNVVYFRYHDNDSNKLTGGEHTATGDANRRNRETGQ
jgi:hypothetical protein